MSLVGILAVLKVVTTGKDEDIEKRWRSLVEEGDEDNLIFRGSSEWCFETEQ